MSNSPLLYIGTYTRRGGKGIYVARFDTETGEIGEVTLAAEASNPSFLALHPSQPILYAANELAEGGVRFRHAYSSIPSCTPARAGIITGMDPWKCDRGPSRARA